MGRVVGRLEEGVLHAEEHFLGGLPERRDAGDEEDADRLGPAPRHDLLRGWWRWCIQSISRSFLLRAPSESTGEPFGWTSVLARQLASFSVEAGCIYGIP